MRARRHHALSTASNTRVVRRGGARRRRGVAGRRTYANAARTPPSGAERRGRSRRSRAAAAAPTAGRRRTARTTSPPSTHSGWPAKKPRDTRYVRYPNTSPLAPMWIVPGEPNSHVPSPLVTATMSGRPRMNVVGSRASRRARRTSRRATRRERGVRRRRREPASGSARSPGGASRNGARRRPRARLTPSERGAAGGVPQSQNPVARAARTDQARSASHVPGRSTGHRVATSTGGPARLHPAVRAHVVAVAADRRPLAPDRRLLDRGDHGVGGRRRDLDRREAVGDVDRPDVLAGQVRLVGDGADEVAGADAVVATEVDEQPGLRPGSLEPPAGMARRRPGARGLPRLPGRSVASARTPGSPSRRSSEPSASWASLSAALATSRRRPRRSSSSRTDE